MLRNIDIFLPLEGLLDMGVLLGHGRVKAVKIPLVLQDPPFYPSDEKC